MKLSEIQQFLEAIVPSGSFVPTVINDNGNYYLRRVTLDKLGATGPQGEQGDDGATILNGTVAPTASQGSDNDYYINTSTGAIYQKVSGTWVLKGSLKGPQGTQGIQGDPGADAEPDGASGYVQFHDGGSPAALAGDSTFTFDSTNDELSVDNVKLGVKTETYALTVTLDFREQGLRKLSVTGAVTFASSNLAAGRSTAIRLTDDGSGNAVNFPAGWTFLGTKPTNLTASKVSVLSLTSFGTTDADVVAAWAEEA